MRDCEWLPHLRELQSKGISLKKMWWLQSSDPGCSTIEINFVFTDNSSKGR